VFANMSELDAWRAGRDRAPRGQQDRPARPSLSLASGRTIAAGVLALVITAFGAYLASRAWPGAPPATRIEGARQAHMRGLYYWNKRTEEGFRLALDQFTQALDHDPGYAPAWVGMADTFALMGYYRMLPVNEAYAKAKAAAVRAIHIDETLAEAHVSLGGVLFVEWDWAGAEREYRRAIALKPTYATARHWYSNYLAITKRYDAAIAEAEAAVALDPLSPILATGALAHAYILAERYAEAIVTLRRTLDVSPGFANAHIALALSLSQQGLFEEAVEEFRRADHLTPAARAQLGVILAKEGETNQAREILASLEEGSTASPVSLAALHAVLGNRNRARVLLERAFHERDAALIEAATSPVFDGLRHDPACRALLQRLNLPS
jgi:tetratricopeptide (TPR) repeat protein